MVLMPMTNPDLPANRIRKCREMSNLSRAELAVRLGKTEFTVIRYEKGRTGIPLEELKVMADLFGVTADYLLGWDNGDGRDAA